LLVAIVPFRVGDAAAVQPMQCEVTAPSGAAKYAVARLFRSAWQCGNADASGYDRTPRVSLRSASVIGFYADRPAKKRRPPPVKTRSILIRLMHPNACRNATQIHCCDALEHRSTEWVKTGCGGKIAAPMLQQDRSMGV
jgi:hypothetical protein